MSQAVEAEFICCHHPDNTRVFDLYQETLTRYLKQGHRVLAVIEDAHCPLINAVVLETVINKFRVLPSNAFNSMPTKASGKDDDDYQNSQLIFQKIGQILDFGMIEFPNQLYVLSEAMSDQYLDQNSEFWRPVRSKAPDIKVGRDFTSRYFDQQIETSRELVMNGLISEAVDHFTPANESMALEIIIREPLMTDRLKIKLTEDPEINSVVGLWGANHTGLLHLFNRMGLQTKMIFPEKENGSYFFDPTSALIRRIRFSLQTSSQPLQKLEWYQAVISDAIFTTMTVVSSQIPDDDVSLTSQ